MPLPEAGPSLISRRPGCYSLNCDNCVLCGHAFREVPRLLREADPGLSALAPQLHLRLHPARVVERADAQEGDCGHSPWIDGYWRTTFRAEISSTNRPIIASDLIGRNAADKCNRWVSTGRRVCWQDSGWRE